MSRYRFFGLTSSPSDGIMLFSWHVCAECPKKKGEHPGGTNSANAGLLGEYWFFCPCTSALEMPFTPRSHRSAVPIISKLNHPSASGRWYRDAAISRGLAYISAMGSRRIGYGAADWRGLLVAQRTSGESPLPSYTCPRIAV